MAGKKSMNIHIVRRNFVKSANFVTPCISRHNKRDSGEMYRTGIISGIVGRCIVPVLFRG